MNNIYLRTCFRLLYLLIPLLALQTQLLGQTGFNSSFAVLSINSGANAYYDMQAATGNPDLEGAALGTFTSANSLVIKGAEHNVYKCGTCDIWQTTVYYRVYQTGATPPAFTPMSIGYASGAGNGCGGQDQQWANTAGTTDVLSGLSYGCYTLEMYSSLDYQFCGSGQTLANNTGANYKATFSYTSGALNGTYSVGTGKCFSTIASAVSTLNANGISGPVTFNVDAGHTETLAGKITLTATGTASNPIIFQKSGAGANPKLTSYVGTIATPAITADGFFVLAGSDYVTIDGIDLFESAANTTTTTVMEFGYALTKTSATDGAQNNTIKNCNITLNRVQNTGWTTTGHNGSCAIVMLNCTNLAATAITTTATSGSNSFNKFYNNTIDNCNAGIVFVGFAAVSPFTFGAGGFGDTGNEVGGTIAGTGNTITNFGGGAGATLPSTGIFASGQWDLNCSYNNLNSNNGSGVNHPNTLRGIFLNASSTSASANCNYNTVSIKGGATTSSIYAIDVEFGSTAASNTININNNIVENCTYTTATSGILYCIYLSSSAQNVNINNNTIRNNTNNNSTGLLYGINWNGATPNITLNGNLVENLTKTLNGSVYAMYSGSSAVNETVTNNIVRNISTNYTGTLSTTIYGIYQNTAAGTKLFTGNKIYNLSSTATGTSNSIYALRVGYGTTITIANDTIYNISGNSILVRGIEGTGTTASATYNIYNNRVYDISSTNAATTMTLYGISSTGGTSCTYNIYNNLIGNITAPSSATPEAIRGISITGTSTNANVYVDFNTIYLNASSTGANFGATGVYHTSNATATTFNLTMRNNLIYNNSTAAGTGIVTAYRRSTTALNNYNANSDRNIYYAGTPGAANLLYYDGTNSAQDLTTMNSFLVGTEDDNSYTENVTFPSTTGSSANFLKPDLTTASVFESGGSNIGISTDYAGTTRASFGGYAGTGSAPDVGAWELNGIALGGCSGSPATSNAVTTNASPCTGANFTLSLDVVFGLGYAFQWEESTTGPSSGFAPISGATNATLITNTALNKWYRCAVTCVASAQTTNSASVAVSVTLMSGTYTINNTLPTGSGNFASFVDALTELSCKGVSGPVIFNVSAGQTFAEATNLECTFTGTSVNTITFQKAGAGANPKITRIGTTGTTDYVLKLTGVDYYTFNGIDFEQTGTSATDWVEYGVWITNASTTNGANNNTLKNGVINLSGANTSAKGVVINSAFTAASAAGAQSSNKFLNMSVQNTFIGYNITGSSTTFLDDANEIGTELSGTSMISALGDGSAAASMYGVFATYQTNFKVKNTEISGFYNGGTSLIYGITLQTSALNTCEFSGNNIHDIFGGGTVYAIYISSASTAQINNNRVYGINTATATSSAVRGIYVTATGITANIYNNQVYDISSSGLTTTTASGIDVATGLVFNIYNNMVSDIRASASTTTTAGVKGISVSGGSTGGVVKIYNNSVYLTDVATAAAYTSAALHNGSVTPTLDIRNNIFVNASDISTAGTRVAAFWKTVSTDNVDNNSNNNLLYSGTPDATHLIYYDAVGSIQTIAGYQAEAAISPGETNARTENVAWQTITNGVLRPHATIPTYIENGGLPIVGYTTDFEGDTRNVTTPDMGADEGTFVQYFPPAPDCATYVSPADMSNTACSYQTTTLKWTGAATGGPVTLGYDVYFGTSATPPFVVNQSTTSYSPVGLLPNTTYYWKIVPKNAGGDAVGCATYSFTTINAELTGAAGDTRCGTGVVNLTATGSGTITWYTVPSGGVPVATNSPYSPSISATTNYYVAAEVLGAPTITGRLASSAPGTATTLSTYGHDITFTKGVLLNSVDVFSTTGTAVTINLYDAAGTTLLQTTGSKATTTNAQNTIPVNFNIPAGTYRLNITMTGSFYRESSGTVYPVSLDGNGQINGFFSSLTGTLSTTASYYFMYNLNITSACATPRTMVTGTVETPATATAGSNQAICAGSTHTLNGSFGGSATSATWTTSGDGAFDNASSMTAIYTPGTADIAAGTATLTLTTNDPAGVCTPAISFFTLTINPPASVASVTGANAICMGGTETYTANSVVLGGGTGAWSSSDITIATVNSSGVVTPVMAGTCNIVYTITGGCGGTVSAQKSITISTRPTSVVSGGGTVCNGATLPDVSIALTGAGPWNLTYTDGTTPTTVTGTSTNPYIITGATAGTYTVTALSDANCTSIAADMTGSATVTVNPRPTSVVSGGGAVCNGSTFPDVSIALTGTGPWNLTYTDGTTPTTVTGTSTNPYVITGATVGTYTVTALSDANCTAIAADMTGSATVTVNPRPTSVVSGGGTVCSSSALPDVSIALTGTGPWTLTYTDGATPTTVTATSTNPYVITGATAGTYTVTALNDANCTAIAADRTGSATVTVNPRPTSVVSGGGTVCSSSALPDVSIALTGTGPWNLTYTDGTTPTTVTGTSTNPYVITGATAGTYTVTALSDANCTAIAADMTGSATVIVNAAAISDAGANKSTCPLTGVALAATGTGTWSGGLGTFSNTTSPTATYTPDGSEAGTTVTLTWTVLGTSPCPNATDNVDVVVAPFSTTTAPTNGSTWAADFEYTDATGWTHYYNKNGTANDYCDDYLLLSLKKNGNVIGTIGTAPFAVEVKGVGGATHVMPDVTAPNNYVSSADWWVMSRYWEVTPTAQPTSDINVRFYYKTVDYSSVSSALPTPLTGHTDLKFFKINNPTVGTYNANPTAGHLDIPKATTYSDAGYWQYNNGVTASSTDWAYTALPSGDHSAESVVAKFSGGGGGGGSQNGAFPVDLLSFDGFNAGNINILNWITATETNFNHFEVMRSTDNIAFAQLATVPHKGINGAGAGYSFTDANPASGINYYRLNMVDVNGTVRKSNIVEIRVDGGFQYAMYPNPVSNKVNITLNGFDAKAVIYLNNALGQTLQTIEMTPDNGNMRTMDMSEFAKGVYFYQIQYKGKNYTGKLIKE